MVWVWLGVIVAMVVAGACAGGSSPREAGEPPPTSAAEDRTDGPVAEVVTARPTAPLDPLADPRTPQGELRARYLPIWSPDFDWAFPPEVCGSDWALDAIAEPTAEAELFVLGDAVAAAALSVMRFEYLVSRSLAEPDVLAQLCIAVATLDPARSEALERLETYLATGNRSAEPAGFPDEVIIVAASPTAMLAVACVAPGSPAIVTSQSEILDEASATAGLAAYLLGVSRGLEDAVTDISYRVANTTYRSADGCVELGSWGAEWERQAQEWAAEGAIWGSVGRTVTADGLCDTPPPEGPDECPRDWTP